MEIDKWVGGYKVRSFPWVDGKHIYFNLQYFNPGQSLAQPPAMDKTVYITDNAAGQRLVNDFTSTLAEYVARLQIPAEGKVIITALPPDRAEIKEDATMLITQTAHAWRDPQTVEYHDDITDIRKAATKYGRTNDTIRLYDGDTLKAIATWPQGGKAYKYCYSPEYADNPGAWRY